MVDDVMSWPTSCARCDVRTSSLPASPADTPWQWCFRGEMQSQHFTMLCVCAFVSTQHPMCECARARACVQYYTRTHTIHAQFALPFPAKVACLRLEAVSLLRCVCCSIVPATCWLAEWQLKIDHSHYSFNKIKNEQTEQLRPSDSWASCTTHKHTHSS